MNKVEDKSEKKDQHKNEQTKSKQVFYASQC